MIQKIKSATNTNNYNTYNIIIYVFVLILLLIVLYIIKLRSKYSIQYEWWDTYDGKNYDQFLNLTNMLLARESRFLYFITRFFGSNLYNSLTAEQIDFLFNYVMPFIYLKLGNTTQGFVLPRHLTRDIKFKNGDNLKFEQWRGKNSDKIRTTDTVLVYDSDGNPQNNGVYPGPTDTTGWKFKFNEWGIPKDKWTIDENHMQIPNLDDTILKSWFDTDEHADNFLAMYGILPDSPLCISFINGYYNSGSLKLDTQSFKKLVGGSSGSTEGGWIGYLQGLGSNEYDRYANFMLSSYNYKDTPPKPSNSCNSGSPGQWGSALGSAAGIAAMALFPGVGQIAAGILIFTGLVVGVSELPPLNQKC